MKYTCLLPREGEGGGLGVKAQRGLDLCLRSELLTLPRLALLLFPISMMTLATLGNLLRTGHLG